MIPNDDDERETAAPVGTGATRARHTVERATFALRGHAMIAKVRAFSRDVAARRALVTPRTPQEVAGSVEGARALLAELDVHGEELTVAEAALQAQVDELAQIARPPTRSRAPHHRGQDAGRDAALLSPLAKDGDGDA